MLGQQCLAFARVDELCSLLPLLTLQQLAYRASQAHEILMFISKKMSSNAVASQSSVVLIVVVLAIDQWFRGWMVTGQRAKQ